MSVMNVYEKMMKEGKLSKPIKIQQPTPDNPHGGMSGDGEYNIQNIVNEKIVPEKKSFDLNEIESLKNRVKFLEDSSKIIMEQHLQILQNR